MARTVQAPLDEATVKSLRAGERVVMTGTIYAARDAAHKRLVAAMERGEELPLPLAGQVIYYVGPAPAKQGAVIGPAGPTTSGRMDPYTLPLLERGVAGLIGKGSRSEEVKQALVQHGAVYFGAVGGASALLARQIRSSRLLAYPDLLSEAIRELEVEEFPLFVLNDCHGGDAYQAAREAYRSSP
ncbi:MAG: FumA C-terminus/TtdB family hydratase beta subunit [Caldilineaceae bacterium]|nr:FumA C-terminus/TtdB family hydratase beta subunit [Caldilineaceae bacterium]MDE0336903.1 FumA C-terminus/TtdB family hydratase beta subunit [Caldilineaceae bacterium]